MRIYRCRDPAKVRDALTGKIYTVEDRRARYLVSLYSPRFSFVQPNQFSKKENNMPAMPQAPKKLPNGVANLVSVSHETVEGKYGLQEKVTVIVQQPKGYPPKSIWISHKSYKQIRAALDCGLAEMVDESTWEIVDGALLSAIVENGRFATIMPYETQTQGADEEIPEA